MSRNDIPEVRTFLLMLSGNNKLKYITDMDLLDKLLDKYPNIKLCLDIGRIHLQDTTDPSFCGYDFVKRFAKYAELVHLWNAQVDSGIKNIHFPALPSLKKEDGWADVETYIRLISERNKSYKINFEHKSDLITDEELEDCYQWISGLI